MNQFDCRIGQKVVFGRTRGEKTLGVVVACNNKKAKVQTLESRGKSSPVGTVWSVPYSLLEPADPGLVPSTTRTRVIPYDASDAVGNALLNAFLEVYLKMATLTGAPSFHGTEQRSICARQIKGLSAAYGSMPTEAEVLNWAERRESAA